MYFVLSKDKVNDKENKNVGIFGGGQDVNNAHSNSSRSDFPFPSIQEDCSSKYRLYTFLYQGD